MPEEKRISQPQAVQSAIQSSRYRCEHAGLPCFEDKLPEVSEEAKANCIKHISGHTMLIRESSPKYYSRLTEALDAHKAVLFYVAPNFDIYGRYGNEDLKAEFKSLNLRFGCNISEDRVGTNAAVISARISDGVWTVGKENYAKALHPYAFFAFSVSGRYNRSVHILLGTRVENLTPATISFFRLVESTESVYSSGALTEDVLVKDALLRKRYSAQSTENILIILGRNSQITYANEIFYDLFKTNYNEVINYPLKNVVPELAYVQEAVEQQRKLPQPRRINFSSVGNVDYHVSCMPANEQSAGSGVVITAQRMLNSAPRNISPEGGSKYTFADLVGVSDKFCQLKSFAERIASTSCTVLIRGESGTGKELFAHSIHTASDRWDKPFVSINCAAIPRELIGSELFGYVGGAFTGANRTGAKGKFEQADGGTLFLDEIGEMPTDMQSVLLRVLEEGAITRIGGSKPIPVNVRLIVATNQNLEEYIRDGKFRLDLFYRLNIISLNTIPLREHKEDIDVLADSFVSRFSARHGKPCEGISAQARAALRQYDWPGNTRELRNVIERGVITTDTNFIELHHLPPEITGAPGFDQPDFLGQRTGATKSINSYMSGFRRETVEQLMKEYDGNKSKVAKKLGIARTTLYRILKEIEQSSQK